MINIFVVGSKGIPANYGGFETFVENLTRRKKCPDIKYFVSCMGKDEEVFEYNDATCFSIPMKRDSSINRILNVSKALTWVEQYVKQNKNENDKYIVYILGCRVGLLMNKHKRKLKKLGCLIVFNPDGQEWKRDKWNAFEKYILHLSEKRIVKVSDYLICDSMEIRKYIHNEYKEIKEEQTTYIAYGSDISKSKSSDQELCSWLDKFNTKPFEYYLIIGRFVPENNYELMIREFMKSNTTKKLLIITNVEKNSFYDSLEEKLHFSQDERIIFAGTLYEEELVKKIRENAYCYLHGHSVGGTNPSLLEALASTKLNLLFDVVFNREVGENQCLYFNSTEDNLKGIIEYIEDNYDSLTKKFKPAGIVKKWFLWKTIVEEYEDFFVKISGETK